MARVLGIGINLPVNPGIAPMAADPGFDYDALNLTRLFDFEPLVPGFSADDDMVTLVRDHDLAELAFSYNEIVAGDAETWVNAVVPGSRGLCKNWHCQISGTVASQPNVGEMPLAVDGLSGWVTNGANRVLQFDGGQHLNVVPYSYNLNSIVAWYVGTRNGNDNDMVYVPGAFPTRLYMGYQLSSQRRIVYGNPAQTIFQDSGVDPSLGAYIITVQGTGANKGYTVFNGGGGANFTGDSEVVSNLHTIGAYKDTVPNINNWCTGKIASIAHGVVPVTESEADDIIAELVDRLSL